MRIEIPIKEPKRKDFIALAKSNNINVKVLKTKIVFSIKLTQSQKEKRAFIKIFKNAKQVNLLNN